MSIFATVTLKINEAFPGIIPKLLHHPNENLWLITNVSMVSEIMEMILTISIVDLNFTTNIVAGVLILFSCNMFHSCVIRLRLLCERILNGHSWLQVISKKYSWESVALTYSQLWTPFLFTLSQTYLSFTTQKFHTYLFISTRTYTHVLIYKSIYAGVVVACFLIKLFRVQFHC